MEHKDRGARLPRSDGAYTKKLSNFIQALDKKYGAKIWEACQDANRSGTLHFGKSVTFLYPEDKAEQQKISDKPELIDSLIITRHMYWSNKGENWRCWLNFAKPGDSHTTTDSHILIESDKPESPNDLKLKGGQIIHMSKEWDYNNKFQVGYTFSGPCPTGKKTYIEGAMEMSELEKWDGGDIETEFAGNWDDPRLRIENLARTSVIYDMQKGDVLTPSAYCQYVTSFLGSLNGELLTRAQTMMSPSAMVTFYILFLAPCDKELEAAVVEWCKAIKLLDCCKSKDSCIAEFKKHLGEGQKQPRPEPESYIKALSCLKIGSTSASAGEATTQLYTKLLNDAELVKKCIWKDLIRLKIIKFLFALEKRANLVNATTPVYKADFSDLMSRDPSKENLLNDLIIFGNWDCDNYDLSKEDRQVFIELIRGLPQEPPKSDALVVRIAEEKNKPCDPYLSPLDYCTIQAKMLDMYSL
jgi:hypothetical protein